MTTSSNAPVVVANEAAAIDYIIGNTTRSRPILAINGDGQLVVCCKTTAKKHGWEIQGRLYVRVRSSKASINAEGKLVAAPAAPAAKKPARTSMKGKLQADTEKELNALLGL